MSWHGSSFLRAAKPLLSEEDYALVAEAFRNSWAVNRKLSAKIDFAQAYELLSASKQTIEWLSRVEADGAPPSRAGQVRVAVYAPETDRLEHRVWYNADGDQVAECRILRFQNGTIHDEHGGEPTIYVLGSAFTGTEFHQLYMKAGERVERYVGTYDETSAVET